MWYSVTGTALPAGTIYAGDCYPGDRAATDAEVASWQAANAPPAQFTFLQFIGLFTSAEQGAIVGSTDTNVRLFLLMAAGAAFVSLVDSRTKNGVSYLVSQGLLTQDRATAILASTPAAS